jgi:hypothetical protein
MLSKDLDEALVHVLAAPEDAEGRVASFECHNTLIIPKAAKEARIW